MSEFLRARYRALQNRFGTAGVIIAVLALIAALGGTALAASGALTGKQKKEVEKIAKKFAGKPGAPGAAGTNGTNGTNGKDATNGKDGAEGKQGAEGKAGKDGTNGTPGTPGVNGKSVEAFPVDTGEPECGGNGGAIYEVEGEPASAEEICNGKEGKAGKDGSPWTAGGTLPPGQTETGVWAFTGSPSDTEGVPVPISFPIPLSARLQEENVHFQEEDPEAFADACGESAGAPAPIPGALCVYRAVTLEGTTFEGIFPAHTVIFPDEEEAQGTSKQGAVLLFGPPSALTVNYGTFAVRAPAAP